MLSAAYDIIKRLDPGSTPHVNGTNQSDSSPGSCDLFFDNTTNMSGYLGRSKCEHQGTSVREYTTLGHMTLISVAMPTQVILLADIIPTFIIKLVAPYFMNFLPYW